MASILSFLVMALAAMAVFGEEEDSALPKSFGRSSFPAGFLFGAASSAYQAEGAAKQGGRGPTIWDYFTEKHPEKIANGSNGDISIDMYHHYKEDIKHMKDTGLDAFRFSISWTRILPNGKLSGGINKEGVAYYNNFINELLSRGIQPLVTIFHWDSPQSLETEYGGFLSPRIVEDFKNYADLVFKLYGDRVKNWITFNEPYSYCERGYTAGLFAPGRCSDFLGCAAGDSIREPYMAGHNMLLAHAAAVKVYRDEYQVSQKGKIGITLVSNWYIPYSNSKADYDASIRAFDFYFGWFMDPLTTGDYPFTMRVIAGERLPKFTPQQSKMLRGSYDFIGLNYYTTYYTRSISLLINKVNFTIDDDIHVSFTSIRDGKPIGEPAGSDWLLIYPQGLRLLLLYIKEKYNNPAVYITENGVDTRVNSSMPLKEVLNDDMRIRYLQGHLLNIYKAIGEGANVQGYFYWSMFDSFEWGDGYTVRFGLYYVDFKTLQRLPTKSSRWYRNFLGKDNFGFMQG